MESYLKSQQRINSPKFRSKDKICLVNAEVENSLDLQIVEFEQAMHDLRRDIYRISSNIGQISRLCGQLGGPEDSHDLRSRLNATMEITKNAIKALNDKIQAIIPRCSSIPVKRKPGGKQL